MNGRLCVWGTMGNGVVLWRGTRVGVRHSAAFSPVSSPPHTLEQQSELEPCPIVLDILHSSNTSTSLAKRNHITLKSRHAEHWPPGCVQRYRRNMGAVRTACWWWSASWARSLLPHACPVLVLAALLARGGTNPLHCAPLLKPVCAPLPLALTSHPIRGATCVGAPWVCAEDSVSDCRAEQQ